MLKFIYGNQELQFLEANQHMQKNDFHCNELIMKEMADAWVLDKG